MQIKLSILLVFLLVGLAACNQTSTPIVADQTAIEPAPPDGTSTPVATTLPTAIPSLAPTAMGSGAYWVASTYMEPDGQFAVFITQPLEGSTPEIIFRAENGLIPRSLTWSPNGQYLFFTIYSGGDSNSTKSFYLYDRLSRELQTFDFEQMTGAQGWVWHADWSPEPQSGKVAFTLCASTFDCSLWMAEIFQSKASQLKDQRESWTWGLDGSSLIFKEGMLNEPIRFDLQNLTEEKIPSPTRSQIGQTATSFRVFGYFPNLDKFLISRNNDDGTSSYFLISPDGSQETLLFQVDSGRIGDLVTSPYLSPDGKQIAFNFTGISSEPLLVTGSLEQLPLQVPEEPNSERGLLLDWSPDSHLYITQIDQHSTGGSFSLGIFDAETGKLLTNYQPQPPFSLQLNADYSSDEGFVYTGFDSVWIP